MAQHPAFDTLAGQVLIAMPGMGDPRFEQSVVYLCDHGPEGAMGLIINKTTPDLDLAALLKQVGVTPTDRTANLPIHFGGPVALGRGFVLHSADYRSNSSTLQVDAQIGMTATMDILEDIASGTGPATCLLALGYAGWGPGQLERELGENGWLTGRIPADLLFDPDNSTKWARALRSLGIDPSLLSAQSGRA